MLIDVHCHTSPKTFPASPSETSRARWPCMLCSGGVDSIYFGEKPFRKLDARSWEVGRRMEDMDRDEVAMQVLSPMPELLSYWLPSADAEVLADHVNAHIAELASHAPSRFRGLGMAPLQDVSRAVAYLPRLKSFGLSGIEIGSNVNGIMLGDPALEPFFDAAEELSLAVFVHALHPVVSKVLPSDDLFNTLIGFPSDVALATASVIFSGLLERHPRLRIGFSHGGGALGGTLGRLDSGWSQTNGFGGRLKERPRDQVRRLFFDSNVYDTGYLRHIALEMAPGQVFVGTDYPYVIAQQNPSGYIAEAGLPPEAEASVRNGAALNFLGGDER